MRGIPPCDYRLLICGTRYSGIAILSQGLYDVQIVGTLNGDKFTMNTLMPILKLVTICNYGQYFNPPW